MNKSRPRPDDKSESRHKYSVSYPQQRSAAEKEVHCFDASYGFFHLSPLFLSISTFSISSFSSSIFLLPLPISKKKERKMEPNPNEFPILCFLLNHQDPQAYPSLPTELHHSLITQFPHLNNPKVLPSLTQILSDLNVTHTLSLLRTLGPRPDPAAVIVSRAEIAEAQLAEQPLVADSEVQVHGALVRLEEMHEECVKRLKGVEERLVEAYGSCVGGGGRGVGDEVDEEVVGILTRADSEEVERVDLSGRQLKILPETFGKIRGLVKLNLSSNQLEAIPDSIDYKSWRSLTFHLIFWSPFQTALDCCLISGSLMCQGTS